MSFGVAVVGCGNISDQYLTNLTAFPDLEVLICADLDEARARAQAEKYGVPASGGVGQALAHPGVRLVVNLTVPSAHYDVASAALAAGKHVWNEKPLTLDPDSGRTLLKEAAQAGVRLGCAPDTFLGAGLQTARRLIDEGAIGVPQTALALMQSPGPESWHPSPEFLFQRGAGPLYDMGPYYLTTLASLFGPAERVVATGRRSRETRVIGSGPKAGTEFPVEVPTHVAALIDYAAGQSASVILSYESPLSRHGFVEITGTEATLALPDPNRFDGSLRLRTAGSDDWTVIGSAGATAGRGMGVLDMARSIAAGVPHRASGEMALHVLETMAAVEVSAAEGTFQPIAGQFTIPEALPSSWDPGDSSLII
ncbi:Gfo/Idh/MocA family oxidoreductase [Streptomyces sp. NPDC051940]|uniref:Gfo/Idh/MocA family protein n=1 Tax=Streptomyces sp. NPDC051940 TaxID=3155675 RepID=UPI0034482596